jgi:hypothetical protein
MPSVRPEESLSETQGSKKPLHLLAVTESRARA